MQFIHDSTSADPTLRPDRGQLARNPATNQIRDAYRCTAVELGDLIQLSSIRCLLRRSTGLLRIPTAHFRVHPEFVKSVTLTKTSWQN